MMDANEREVYRAAIQGDREAFEMIIRCQSRPLLAIAYGILQNREEAEDAVQDALVKAWKSRWRIRDPEKFPAWLCTIARHRARDVFRKRKNTPLLQETDSSHTTHRPYASNSPDLEKQLHSALASLPELHR
ncbi:MAG TPA: sigma-70 family RNA polymerase sigma factor, partial [Chthoniobacterales bacterium]|nr:sigma-70 family RNA polymerase sigma factor [Chthoniobacterales bacterium]